ncbi:hypothetical protein CK203_024492 [Vitis vinifera]|uniref:Retrotransposon Copia-like N-terminal domain-containing protein n=1 Tax=Vitis vinifera TaxID=29760 RepID=A0A438IUI7_VITVI|nr:hypothetical protein CK203_024492 [Vitis vinifera]
MCGGFFLLKTFTWYQSPLGLASIDPPCFNGYQKHLPHLLPFNTMIHMVTIKLSSSNYLLWKSQLLPLLESQELLGHVDGTLAPPPRFAPVDSRAPNIKHLAWKNTDQRLLSLLLSSLTEEAMAKVVGLSTSCEVWLALENNSVTDQKPEKFGSRMTSIDETWDAIGNRICSGIQSPL